MYYCKEKNHSANKDLWVQYIVPLVTDIPSTVLQCACHSFLRGLEDTFSFTFTISKLKTRLQLNPSFPKVYKSLDLWLNKNIKRYLTLFPWKHSTLAPTIVTADSASEGPWVMCIKTMYNLKFVKRPSQYKRNLRSPSSAHLIYSFTYDRNYWQNKLVKLPGI